ncbi:MAG: sigma 54-interacting transcriptional regulator, partial [Myxococcales bacterium]|nr:sigma 54-interacting transcriptional regulator [Myxococcales bacterium]
MSWARESLQQALQRFGDDIAFETLANLCDDAAVFVVDSAQQVVFWSDGAERLLGFPRDEVLGEHCLKSNRCTQCMRGCGIQEHGTVRGVDLTLHDKDGATVELRKSGHAFYDAQGRFAGGIEVLTPRVATAARRRASKRRRQDAVEFHGLITADPAMKRVLQTITNVAETDATALVRGESGVGKELVARALHEQSKRKGGPFIAVNCAALTPTLLESELFGHVKGAFTGAVKDRIGLFKQADKGTLFLDEIAELPLELQAKLLRVIEEREVVPVGAIKPVRADVRVIAATHRSLRREVKANRFREDLMFRLRVVPIFVPPLRERRGDIELLLWHFIEQQNRSAARFVDTVSPEAMRALLDYGWPGNVRELRNVVEYAFAVSRGATIDIDELPPEFREATLGAPRPTPAAAASNAATGGNQLAPEAQRIQRALDAAGGHIGQAAELLGISRPTLWRKRKKYG